MSTHEILKGRLGGQSRGWKYITRGGNKTIPSQHNLLHPAHLTTLTQLLLAGKTNVAEGNRIAPRGVDGREGYRPIDEISRGRAD